MRLHGHTFPRTLGRLQIATDIPTHSSEYYAVPFLYPLSDRTFDGVARTRPEVLAVNFILLAAVYAALSSTARTFDAHQSMRPRGR